MLTRFLCLLGFGKRRVSPTCITTAIAPRNETAIDLAREVISHPYHTLLHPRTVERFQDVAHGSLPSRTDVKALRQFASYLRSEALGGGNA